MSRSSLSVLPKQKDLVVVQRNPTSGSGRGKKQLLTMIRELRRFGFTVRMFADRDQLDQFVERDSRVDRIRCLVAAGGDGTVASLANRHSAYPIAVLPMGTENLVARHLRIPRCGSTAAQVVIDGATKRFDTAFVNDQRFLLMVSAGIDADVVRRLSSVRSGHIRHSSYVVPILQCFFTYAFPKLTVHGPDGDVLGEGTHVVVTNIPEYGFRMPFAPRASAHDGELDVRIFQRRGALATIWHAVRTRLGASDRDSEIHRLKISELEIRSSQPKVPVQFDGDPGGCCPVRIHIDPASMTLVVRGSDDQ